ncbi:HNH endonuclease, partial [Vibrio cholerae]|nr:HNH endonuclease [Vibrio cholerae]
MSNDNRKSPSPNLVHFLHHEVNGKCPICSKKLVKKSKDRFHNLAEIAHIYPCNPKPEEETLLNGEERLGDDVNCEENLIALCKECHRVFDNPRTVEGYREMVALKRELIKQANLKRQRAECNIEIDFQDVLIWLHDADVYTDESIHLSLKALKVSDKVDTTVKPNLKFKITTNVTYYYLSIQQQLKILDTKGMYTSEIIRTQVKTYYLKLKKIGLTHNEIFHEMCNWILDSGIGKSIETCEIVVSF